MIAIYLNTIEWGGVDVLVARFAEYLRTSGIDFCIVEGEASRLREQLQWATFVTPGQESEVACKVTHVLVPSVPKLRVTGFPWRQFSHAKVFSWVVHPNSVFRSFFPMSSLLMQVFGYRPVRALRWLLLPHTLFFDDLFVVMTESGAIGVMDGATRRSLKYFVPKIEVEVPLIPIPTSLVPRVRTLVGEGGGLSVGYLGRMDAMKWSAFGPFLKYTLAPIARLQPVELHAVAEGPALPLMIKTCKAHGINVHSYGYMRNDQARELITAKTHLAVAMGTSALDIAGTGHPCIVLDPALGLFSGRQTSFRFIDESKDFTVGEYRDFPGYVRGMRSFAEAVDGEQLRLAAVRGRKYVRESHNPTRCFEALLCSIQSSRMTCDELQPFIYRLNTSFSRTRTLPGLLTYIFRLVKVPQ